ncbi:hypothetical protein ACWGJ2_07005 [Streptomyces sp. NPDC054796]
MITGFHTSVRFEDPARCSAEVRAVLTSHRVVRLSDVPGDIDHGAFSHAPASQPGDFHFKDEGAATAALERDGWLDIRYADGLPAFNWGSTRVSSENPPHVRDMARRFADFREQRIVDGGPVAPVPPARGEAVTHS